MKSGAFQADDRAEAGKPNGRHGRSSVGRRRRDALRAATSTLAAAAALLTLAASAHAAENDHFVVNRGTADHVLDVLDNDGYENPALIITVTPPDHGGEARITTARDAIVYTPAPGFTGVERFHYTVLGDNRFEGASVTVDVIEPNTRPSAADDRYSTTEGATLTVGAAEGVLANDSDADGDALTAVLAEGPEHGELALDEDGAFTYTPSPGFAGEDRFTYRADDGIATSRPAVVRIEVERRTADLRVTMSAGPNPLGTGAEASWTVTITNEAETRAESIALAGRFAGTVPFNFDAADDPACTLAPDDNATELTCPLGPLAAGDAVTIELTGSGSQPGDVLGTAHAEVEGAVERTPEDNRATAALSIAAEIAREPALTLDGFAALGLAAADLDGDGYDDLAVATPAEDTVRVYLNAPDAANEKKRTLAGPPIAVGSPARDNAIAAGDLDGDGDTDLVASGAPGQPARVYLNDGTGTFEAFTVGDGTDDPRAVALGDVDGDGFTDLVFANAGPNAVYFGEGVAGAYSAASRFGGGASAGLAVADLFGDTRPELVFTDTNGDARIYRHDGSALVHALSVATGPATSVAAVDVNADGALDLVFGRDRAADPNALPSNLYYSNTSGASPSFFRADELGAAPTFGVLTGDADDDGDADAIVLNATGAHQVFTNSGNPSNAFLLAPAQTAAAGARAGALGRFNADARPDLALGGPEGVRVFYNDGTGRFGLGDTQRPTITLNGAPSVTLEVGSTYEDPGATATDDVDGDLTDEIEVDNPVDTNLVGTYVISYNVADSSGNRADTVTRSVEIEPVQSSGGGGGAAGWLVIAAVFALLRRRARSATPPLARSPR